MLAKNRLENKFEGMHKELSALQDWVREAAQEGTSAHKVERHLWRKLLKLGYQLFGAFLQQQGKGDVGETFTLPDGHTVNRLDLHERRLVTLFGEYEFKRYAYGTREGQEIELIPLDQRLDLPESDFSYVVQEWDQMLGIEHAFGRVVETMRTILRLKQSVDSAERMNRQMAEASEPFRGVTAGAGTGFGGETVGRHGR